MALGIFGLGCGGDCQCDLMTERGVSGSQAVGGDPFEDQTTLSRRLPKTIGKRRCVYYDYMTVAKSQL